MLTTCFSYHLQLVWSQHRNARLSVVECEQEESISCLSEMPYHLFMPRFVESNWPTCPMSLAHWKVQGKRGYLHAVSAPEIHRTCPPQLTKTSHLTSPLLVVTPVTFSFFISTFSTCTPSTTFTPAHKKNCGQLA